MLDIVYYDSHPNFGDDLNRMMWQHVLPEDVRNADGAAMFGIGSILTERYANDPRLAGKRVYVLGSGAGYGVLPSTRDKWRFLAVRGPLTAELIGQPQAAATDAAALLATMPDALPRSAKRDAVLFMPHYQSTWGGHWPEACRAAGLEFVDPSWTVDKVFEALSRAKLVVTEAMHGAIVADTLRIPWIPVATSQTILPFKWNDWGHSVGLSYQPIAIPPSSLWEALRQRRYAKDMRALGVPTAFETAGYGAEQLVADFRARYVPGGKTEDPGTGKVSGSRRLARDLSQKLTWPFVDRAAKGLREAAKARPFLSDDAKFAAALERLVAARDRFVAEVRAG